MNTKPTTLFQVRQAWERNFQIRLCVTTGPTPTPTVLVILEDVTCNQPNRFRLHRYFTLGNIEPYHLTENIPPSEGWNVSVDFTNITLERAIDQVHLIAHHNYPKFKTN